MFIGHVDFCTVQQQKIQYSNADITRVVSKTRIPAAHLSSVVNGKSAVQIGRVRRTAVAEDQLESLHVSANYTHIQYIFFLLFNSDQKKKKTVIIVFFFNLSAGA